jgi:AAA domain
VTRSPRVVELIGAPGTGKSSVAAAIERAPGVVVAKDRRRRDLPGLLWSAATAGRVLYAKPPVGVSRLRWIAWIGRCRAAPRIARRRLIAGVRTLVLDQGPVYTLGRMSEAASRDPAVARWHRDRVADCGRFLDAVIVLDAASSQLADRLRSRAKSHRADDLSMTAATAYLERERAISRSIAVAVASAGAALVEVDATNSLDENISVVMAVLDADPARAGDNGAPA